MLHGKNQANVEIHNVRCSPIIAKTKKLELGDNP